MPNSLAMLVLAIWPAITVALFVYLPAGRAIIATLLAGYLFLPEPPAFFDFPLIPPLTKHTIPALSALAMCIWKYGNEGSFIPRIPTVTVLCAIYILSPMATTMTNSELVRWGDFYIRGMSIKDGIALVIQQGLLLIPFLLARRFLADAQAQRDLMIAFVIGGLVYSIPMLIEIRFSPQMNMWVYGYYQHDFIQTIRFGGFRPMVFLYHGIWAAFYTLMAILAAFALWRASEGKQALKFFAAGAYLVGILILAKSLGAWLFAGALVPMMLFFSRGMQIRIAVMIAAFAIAYPALKGINVIPQDRILEAAAAVDEERALSLGFRFGNENLLLERASEKALFGWGSYNRNQILDPANGEVETVTDGRWVILIGQFGWVGFLAEFGLLVLPVFLLWWGSKSHGAANVSPLIAPISLMLAINVFDMLPNATLTPLTWLMAGALTGYAERLRFGQAQLHQPYQLKWQPAL